MPTSDYNIVQMSSKTSLGRNTLNLWRVLFTKLLSKTCNLFIYLLFKLLKFLKKLLFPLIFFTEITSTNVIFLLKKKKKWLPKV